MREKQLIEHIHQHVVPISRQQLAKVLGVSESTIRNLIRDTQTTGKKNGFEIELIKGKGYRLQITNDEQFKTYLAPPKAPLEDTYDPDQRLSLILFHLLQAQQPITIDELADKLMLARATVVKELKRVDEIFETMGLNLERKVRFGMTVVGKEEAFRRAFLKYVVGTNHYLEPTNAYRQLVDTNEKARISNIISRSFLKHKVAISDVAFENLALHLLIIIYRLKGSNYLKESQSTHILIDTVYHIIATEIATDIADIHKLTLPQSEINLLATHLSAKTKADQVDAVQKEILFDKIDKQLQLLDKEFLTDFHGDRVLCEALFLHIYPLLQRLRHNMQLANPLIDDIYQSYTNVFVVAYRFSELIEQQSGFKLSRDEIGYLALHFAAHFERVKSITLETVKRIVVICATGGGSAYLLQLKLEQIFKNAQIITTSLNGLPALEEDLPDLFLTTIPMDTTFCGIKVVQIKEFLDEMEIKRIRELVMLQVGTKRRLPIQPMGIVDLFSPALFKRITVGSSQYLDIVKNQAQLMTSLGVAADDFVDLVLEREEKFSTIFEKGVGAPHAVKLTAITNSVCVFITDKPVMHEGKEVSMLFMINLKPGYLYLHKQLTQFLMYVMENDSTRNRMLNCITFEQFITEVKKFR